MEKNTDIPKEIIIHFHQEFMLELGYDDFIDYG